MPSATAAPLCCHLLIGPPASGKTTLARALAPLLTSPDEPPALLLSTDAIRAEVFGDAAVQGPWIDIQQRLQQRLTEAVAAGIPVIVDATHARRPWRLALTQALLLPAPVEWIGWWLYTPLPTCLEWNRQRERQVPEAVIQEMAAALADPHFGPSRAEGFAAICAVVPTHHDDLEPLLAAELAALDRRIRSARARETHWQLHGYSRLLDLERLLFLIRLLSRYPELDAADPLTREQLEAIVSPLPSGDLAERAAVFMGRLHGECYGEAGAIHGDLNWLAANGFCFGGETLSPIRLAELPAAPHSGGLQSGIHGGVHGGHPPMGDGPVFQRVMTLLRHLLQVPFDRPAELGATLHQHLIAATESIPGAYLPGETATLRKDLEKVLTPYGFRNRHDNVRHGYALGTAVLSAPRLREIQALVQQAAGRLADPSALLLLGELEQRLAWAGLDEPAPPLRLYARHGVVDTALVRRESLAAPYGAEAIERAIAQRRRVLLKRFSSAGSHGGTTIGDGSGEWRVWPLQLIFHHVGWYLCVEEDVIGQEHGLIRCERLDRLALQSTSPRSGPNDGLRRSPERQHAALQRLERLLHHSGGIFFGDEVSAQLALASRSPGARASVLQTLRFSATPWAFAFLREGMSRYPREQVRFSKPLPDDSWWHHPDAPHVLEPNAPTDSHPYPLELDLPSWTLAADIDLRTWLYGFGEGIRVEAPTALQEELVSRCRAMLTAHGEAVQAATAPGGAASAEADRPASRHRQDEDPPPRAPFPNRLRRG
ncbi:AAA family ATPase [Synechococcus sp. BA-132 BA5]|uniref:AAA family ATPase n=1 Tax=Synechococcus sp. BA-132 BA5 TaxID=3110252 RepID=UPI002B21F7EB|nr:AAA family ATPase [Synechococcus sp. BA-132 BA5]MEA5414147.1 AAA family ATPase [Synechococcus sp. BA-132 BA5]